MLSLWGRRMVIRPQARISPWRSSLFALPRAFATASSSALRPQTSIDVLPHGGPGTLADLAERSSRLPKPEVFDERLQPGFRGGRALFIFFLVNAIPFTGLLYYLREKREERAQLSLLSLPLSADDVVAEVLRVIRTSSTCFLQRHGDANGGVLLVDPHLPEGSAYCPPVEPLPILPQMERNVITDALESPPSAGLGFIHFALSRNSSAGQAVVAGDRRAHLLYTSGTRGAYCTVTGHLSILSDPESRRRYWKNFWAYSFPSDSTPEVSSTPSASIQSQSQAEPLSPWCASDYLLVRLAVADISLHAIVDGPQRWDARRARRLDGISGGKNDSSDWVLVAPGEA